VSQLAANRVAWGLWAVCVLLAAGMAALGASGVIPHEFGNAFLGMALLGCATVGALLASRRRDNDVGWVLLAIAVFAEVGSAIDGYANSGLLSPGGIDSAIGWAAGTVDYVWIGLIGFVLPLIFPTGRPPTPRWRIVIWLGAVAVGLLTIGDALRPGPLDLSHGNFDNPLGIADARTALSIGTGVGTALGVGCFVAAGISVVQRFRRAEGDERLQLKWFAYVLAVIATGLAIAALQAPIHDAPGWAQTLGNVGWFLMLVALVFGVPIATGVAILKYRLYDIDVVINRTLVYGSLTAVLAAAYVGGILLLEFVLRPITAQSGLAVAGSTLAVAALFGPLRARIQELVDRRFYRHKYDARRTLEAFSARLRQEIDLETLRSELGTVVLDTVQPAHVSLWLRASGEPE
jgi:uncharacterized membrane protein YidH (DUF202 family)